MREYVARRSHRGLHPAVLDRLVEPWCTAEGRPAFYRQIAQNDQRFTDEVQGRYGELALPVLDLLGHGRHLDPGRARPRTRRRIPGARLRLIEEAGHLVQEDGPESVVAAVLETLDGNPGG